QEPPMGGPHRLRAVTAAGLPLTLWLHCGRVVYHNEHSLQVILRPAHGRRLPDKPASRHILEPLSSDPHEMQAATSDCLRPEIQHTDDSALRRLQTALQNDDFELLFQPLAGFLENGLEHYAVSIR